MDVYRSDDRFFVRFDLPGIDPSSIDLTVERMS
jgi:HSP20 family protein